MGVPAGVDSHKSSLAVGVVDEPGRVPGATEFPNDDRGHAKVFPWLPRCGERRTTGIEGAGSSGPASFATRSARARTSRRCGPGLSLQL